VHSVVTARVLTVRRLDLFFSCRNWEVKIIVNYLSGMFYRSAGSDLS